MSNPAAVDPGLPPQVPAAGKPGLVLSTGMIAAIGGGALLVIFMLQNTENVTLQFLFWEFNWPEWFLVFLSAAVGSLIWIGLGILRRHRRRVARREARRM
jgi:uncharacterized integral membrane protein